MRSSVKHVTTVEIRTVSSLLRLLGIKWCIFVRRATIYEFFFNFGIFRAVGANGFKKFASYFTEALTTCSFAGLIF